MKSNDAFLKRLERVKEFKVVKFELDTVAVGSSTLVAVYQDPILDSKCRIPLVHYTEEKVTVDLINSYGISFAKAEIDSDADTEDVVLLVKQQMEMVQRLYKNLQKEAESAGCSEAEKQFEAVLAMAIPKY
jgi:hypothetical protein